MKALVSLALLPMLLLAGCVSMPAPAYQPGVENTSAIVSTPTVRIGVGDFTAADTVNNRRISLRGNGMTGAGDGSFSTFLKQAVETELRTAGRYQADANTVITGVLLRNDVNAAGANIGKARIEARFMVMRDGILRYDQTLAIDHQWESSFMGMIAVPTAMENYVAAVQKLVGKLFADPGFKEAVAR